VALRRLFFGGISEEKGDNIESSIIEKRKTGKISEK